MQLGADDWGEGRGCPHEVSYKLRPNWVRLKAGLSAKAQRRKPKKRGRGGAQASDRGGAVAAHERPGFSGNRGDKFLGNYAKEGLAH